MEHIKMLKPDTKGRITLGHLADGVSRFAMSTDKHNRIILVPYAEVPIKERWIFQNKLAMHQLQRGLQDAAKGRITKKTGFSKYVNDNDDNE